MDSFWVAQIRDLLEYLSPEEVKQALRHSIGGQSLDLDKILDLVDQQTRLGTLKSLTKQAQEAMYEIWIKVNGKLMLFSRPKSEEEKTKHLMKLLHEQKRDKKDVVVREAQSVDYVGFGGDQMQSNFATPNSEGETGAGTAVSTDGLQGPGGSYFQKALSLKERAKKKREEKKKRREQRLAVLERLAVDENPNPIPPTPGGKLKKGPTKPGDAIENAEDTVEDAKREIIKDTDEVSREVDDTEQETSVKTDKTINKSKEMGDTIKQISDETEENTDKIEKSTNQGNEAIEGLQNAIDNIM